MCMYVCVCVSMCVYACTHTGVKIETRSGCLGHDVLSGSSRYWLLYKISWILHWITSINNILDFLSCELNVFDGNDEKVFPDSSQDIWKQIIDSVHTWLKLRKTGFHTHNSKKHFSPSHVHTYMIAVTNMSCYDLFLRLAFVRCQWVLRWS